MGAGLLCLLDLIETHGSIRQAAQEMELSYVKAHHILQRLERKLGRKVLEKAIGGSTGGGSRLTSFGREFVAAYRKLDETVGRVAERELARLCDTLQLKRKQR